MLHIVSDSSTLLNQAQAEEAGFHSVPLNVVVDKKAYKDYEEISPAEFIEKCNQKAVVSTSQPNIGEKLDLYNKLLSEDPANRILDITIADGLSGTYQSALMAKEDCDDPSRVTVYNSKTLCGPQQGLVLKAVEYRNKGMNEQQIIEKLQKMSDTDKSTVSCIDIGYLVRGGRVSNLKGKVAELMKLIPTVKKEDSGTELTTLSNCRTFSKMFEKVDEFFASKGIDENYTIYVSHGDNPKIAKKAADYFARRYPNAKVIVNLLCPMFISHGGPGCVSIQCINLND
ncbi:MAG: DegV family protein [Erysipelotrichaceae bacterium]|nr:DegV family protein [Erysipelotrichaceae bacterium]